MISAKYQGKIVKLYSLHHKLKLYWYCWKLYRLTICSVLSAKPLPRKDKISLGMPPVHLSYKLISHDDEQQTECRLTLLCKEAIFY